jgi:hypothetical protein
LNIQGEFSMAQESRASNLIPTPNKYKVNLVLATWAGILGQVLWFLFYYPVYFYYGEDSLDLARLFGSFVVADPTWVARLLGLGVLFGIGVGTAWAYAWLLYILNLQSSGTTGFLFGGLFFVPMAAFVIPWTVGFLAQLRDVQMNLPDVLFSQAGHGNGNWDGPLYVLVAYIMYGLVVGSVYRHKLRNQPGDKVQYRIAYLGG